MLCEGYPFVLDLEKSHGQYLHDSLSGKDYLDFFTFYASRPLAFDHPGLADPQFLEKLTLSARHKPSNCDVYTSLFAEFVETFRQHALGPGMKHVFFIDGGSHAVENALKAAFDWKARRNIAAGKGENPGRVIHFTHAFHGRGGYAVSLTNTHDPRKTQYFPKFDWPRIQSPALQFPATDANLRAAEKAEAQALAEIDRAYEKYGQHDIACIIIEPIQAEGGDRHFRPEFLRALRKICDERDTLLIFDEVQTGFGVTGTMWFYEQVDVRPDLVAFAKKAQTGGVMAGARLDQVDSVFKVKSRISSTFGGNLTDFVRCTRYLEIMQAENMLEHVKRQSKQLFEKLEAMLASHPQLSAPRAKGLLQAFDAPDTASRDRIVAKAKDELLLVLPCGDRSVRLRPALDVGTKDADEGISRLDRAVRAAGL